MKMIQDLILIFCVDVVFEQEPTKNLVEAKQLMQFDHDGFWQPMDTMREYKCLITYI
jgi:NDP-sugar pyrophosphorylase family protein